MSVLTLDAMNDAAAWSSVQPDGHTPSTELTIVNDPSMFGEGADKVSARISATPSAVGHLLRRTVPPVDLSQFHELRMSLHAAGAPSLRAPRFLIELRLGSGAAPIDDTTTSWHRLVPITTTTRWETARFSIDDLPAPVASALTAIQIRCISAPFTLNIDDVAACRPQMAIDCDRAVVAALSGMTVNDQPITVAVRAPGEAVPAAPGLNIRHVDAHYAPKRVLNGSGRRDYTTTGYRETRAGTPYDLDYAISPVADTRAQQAALLEAVLDRLPPNGEVIIDGDSHPIELLTVSGTDRIGGAPGEIPVLMYRIGARCPTRVGPPVPEVTRIDVSTDVMVSA